MPIGIPPLSHTAVLKNWLFVLAYAAFLMFAGWCMVGCAGSPTGPSPNHSMTVTPGVPTTGFNETFSAGLSSRWAIMDYTGNGGTVFTPANVAFVQGVMQLKLVEQDGQPSTGVEIQTVDKYGFGRYTFRYRTASDASSPFAPGVSHSGDVSAAFNYVADSDTELDLETLGDVPDTLTMTTWHGRGGKQDGSTPLPNAYQIFHDYTFVWTPSSVTYFVDGTLVHQRTTDIPQTPAFIMFSLWTANDNGWGGTNTTGTHYMYVQSFSFSPLN